MTAAGGTPRFIARARFPNQIHINRLKRLFQTMDAIVALANPDGTA